MRALIRIITFVIFCIACMYLYRCVGRTIISFSLGCLLIAGIVGVSFLFAWLYDKKSDDIVENTLTIAVYVSAIMFSLNFYFPLKSENQIGIIEKVLDLRRSGRHYDIRFLDTGQTEDIYGGLNNTNYKEGDTVIVECENGWLGMSVVKQIKLNTTHFE